MQVSICDYCEKYDGHKGHKSELILCLEKEQRAKLSEHMKAAAEIERTLAAEAAVIWRQQKELSANGLAARQAISAEWKEALAVVNDRFTELTREEEKYEKVNVCSFLVLFCCCCLRI